VRVRVSGTMTTYCRVMVFFSGTGRITVTISCCCCVLNSTHGTTRFSQANVGTQIVRSTMRGAGAPQHGLACAPPCDIPCDEAADEEEPGEGVEAAGAEAAAEG
jgi:hypothetical protein